MSHEPCRSSAAKMLVAGLLVIWGAGVATAEPAYYLVFEVDSQGIVELVFGRAVELSRLPESKSDEQLDAVRATRGFGERGLVLKLLDPANEIVFQDSINVPKWIRGEFHGAPDARGGFEIDSHRFAAGPRAFVARVPRVSGSRVVIDGVGTATFELEALTSQTLPPTPTPTVRSTTSHASFVGSPVNRVDLLIMGDGYTAAQESLFNSATASLQSSFFSISPYDEYENYYNVSTLFTASAESGADHPPYNPSCPSGAPACCADLAAQTDPLAGISVNTAFHSTYCSFNIHRLLTASNSAVLAAASAVPDWDVILLLVNDGTYGGSGGAIPVTSTHSSAVDIARHEYGHAFTDLADEYDSPFPGFPACSDVTSPPCEANVTDESSPGLIKWEPWILGSTPIPTPETGAYASVVGLFEGARYLTTGVYRPRNTACLMHFLGQPFGEICSQAYVLRLYDGGWGVPSGGIDPIESGSENPPPGTVNTSGSVTFKVDLLQPVGGPPVDVTWSVDAVPQPAPTQPDTFEFVPPDNGTYQITLEVEDVTSFVHPAMAGTSLQSTRQWTVQASGITPGDVDTLMVSTSPTVSGNLLLSWDASCSPNAVTYSIYEGTLGVYYSHTQKDCSDDGDPLSEEIAPQMADSYYLVVPLTASSEGSYGLDSDGAQRPTGLSTCEPTQQIGCPGSP